MKYGIVSLAVALAGVAYAPSAHAIRECELLEIECHKVCTLPQVEGGIKDLRVYWVNC